MWPAWHIFCWLLVQRNALNVPCVSHTCKYNTWTHCPFETEDSKQSFGAGLLVSYGGAHLVLEALVKAASTRCDSVTLQCPGTENKGWLHADEGGRVFIHIVLLYFSLTAKELSSATHIMFSSHLPLPTKQPWEVDMSECVTDPLWVTNAG